MTNAGMQSSSPGTFEEVPFLLGTTIALATSLGLWGFLLASIQWAALRPF